MKKHLIISGGGPSMFGMIGSLHTLHDNGVWDIEHLESIYACSSGAWVGVAICLMKLGSTIDMLEEFVVKRPWDKLISLGALEIASAFRSKGVFDRTTVKTSLKPLFKSCGINIETDLQNFYDLTNIDLHMFSTDFNTRPLTKIDISHKTFPNTTVYDALTMTMGLPFVITPTFYNDMCLVDGGIMANYPLQECIDDKNAELDDILGLKVKWDNRTLQLQEDSNLLQFIMHIMKMMVLHIEHDYNKQIEHEHTVHCSVPDVGGPSGWVDVFLDEERRQAFVDYGKNSAKQYLSSLAKKSSEIE